jgi:hypothetical protein
MHTQVQDVSTRTSSRTGFRRRLSIGIVAFAAMATLALPGAGASAADQRLANESTLKLPPGVCYNDAIGTYYCPFKITFPFPPGW